MAVLHFKCSLTTHLVRCIEKTELIKKNLIKALLVFNECVIIGFNLKLILAQHQKIVFKVFFSILSSDELLGRITIIM
jgi:hypothetical protein